MEVVGKKPIEPACWVEALLVQRDDEHVAKLLKILVDIRLVAKGKDELTQALQGAHVVPDDLGHFRRVGDSGSVFLEGRPLSQAAGIRLVRQSLLTIPGARLSLERLGFQPVTPSAELRGVLGRINPSWGNKRWSEFWELVAEVSVGEANQLLINHIRTDGRLLLRTVDGRFTEWSRCIMAGELVCRQNNESTVVDVDFHESHLSVLQALGVGTAPTRTTQRTPLFERYRREVLTAYKRNLPPGVRKPDEALLILQDAKFVGPIDALEYLDPIGRANWSKALLADLKPREAWQVRHQTLDKYPLVDVDTPQIWAVQKHGLLPTSWGPRPTTAAVAPQLVSQSASLPVADVSTNAAAALGLIDRLEDVPAALWRQFLLRDVGTGVSAEDLGNLLVHAARVLPTLPSEIPCFVGSQPSRIDPRNVAVATTMHEKMALFGRMNHYVVCSTPEDAAVLCERWNLRPAAELIHVAVAAVLDGEELMCFDVFRGLEWHLPQANGLSSLRLQACSELAVEVVTDEGTTRTTQDFERDGQLLYYIRDTPRESLLVHLLRQEGVELPNGVVVQLLADAEDAQIRELITNVAAEPDLDLKLLKLVGSARLRSRLPTGLLSGVEVQEGRLEDNQLARLTHVVHGVSVLQELQTPLAEKGLNPPKTWAGSAPARAFVHRLGFPVEYAGFKADPREAELDVGGPPNLAELHDYQRKLADEIRDLAREGERALMYLPTGAGKTRVSAQALIEHIVAGELTNPVVWIAQTEELCEQAIQTWAVLWRQFGDARRLRLCRLWKNNEVSPAHDGVPCVVVATDAKLHQCRKREEYAWLQDSAVVVVDEAHVATESGYRELLTWLGVGPRMDTQGRTLLGLTATPFKGRSEDRTQTLASRFGHRRLEPFGEEDPYLRLQDEGVLARVDQQVLSGSNITMTPEQRRHAETRKQLPPEVLERLGRDAHRNRIVLEDIVALPRDWPVLLFTASVQAAQTMAALLRLRGVTAASVSGETSTGARRLYIQEFGRGRIQVLANCNVLAQGFDAPAVRAIYIARPTFSPNAYIQMIGRGLRGPRNGGKERCLIVNIEDTFQQFGESLAFREFDHLWNPAID